MNTQKLLNSLRRSSCLFLQIASVFIISLISLNTHAEGDEKKFNIGIGTYALTISYPSFIDDEFSGLGLAASYAFTDRFAIRGEYYSLEHDQLSALEVSGTDLVVYFGTGLATQGFKAYIGGGLFNETWEISGFEEDFSGLQINGGFGYNWNVIALDLVLGIRDPSDYEDFLSTPDVTAVSGSLILSARF